MAAIDQKRNMSKDRDPEHVLGWLGTSANYTVVGANAKRPVEVLRQLFGHLPCELHTTSVRAAEMIKYCCNNFHALKIAFANETARLCEALGVDPDAALLPEVSKPDTGATCSPASSRA